MKRAIVAVLACAAAVTIGACAWMGVGSRGERCWESSCIVRVQGPGELSAGNLSLGYMRWTTSPAEGNSGALLLRDGDLLWVEMKGKDADQDGRFVMPWRPEDGTKLSLKMDGPCLVVGERAVSLTLGKDGAGWDWVAQASDKELASLRFVLVDELFSDEQVHAFEKIAGVNPHVGLALMDGTLLARVPALDPRWLMVDEQKMPQAVLDTLAKRNAIEMLVLTLDDADLNLQGLAALPNLRQLTLGKYNSTKTAMPALPRLESLTFSDGALPDLTALKPLTGLRELNFTLAETVSLHGIEALPQLQELGVYGAKDEASLDFAPLDGLKQLRWVAFGPGVTQGKFARVIQTHPDLQVVEVLKCEDIKSLAPLANLRELKALVFLAKEYSGSIEPLKEMKQLRLLVLPDEIFKKNPADVAELRGELPGCVIAEGEPFCLGAGRILLLVPLVALGWLLMPGRRSRAACRAPYSAHSCRAPYSAHSCRAPHSAHSCRAPYSAHSCRAPHPVHL